MTIKLLVAIQGAGGVEIPAGTEVTLTDAVEAAHVSANKAVYTQKPITFDAPPASGVGGKFDPATGRTVITGITDVSGKLRCCVPARDAATRFADVSGNVAHLVPETNNSAPFGTDKYFSSVVAATLGGLNVPAAKIAWNPYSESFVLGVVLKRAAQGSTEIPLSIGANVAGYQGFYLSARATSGKIRITPVKNDTTIDTSFADSTLAFYDGTDRHVTVAYDAPSGSWYIYRDGVLSDAYVGKTVPGSASGYQNSASSGALRIGGLDAIAGAATAVTQGYGLQFAKYAGALPLNVGLIAARLAETPRVPLTALEW